MPPDVAGLCTGLTPAREGSVLDSDSLTEDAMEETQPTPSARDLVIGEIRRDYPPLLTVPQVAQLMQCSVADVYDKVHQGEIPAVRWGKQFRFFRDEVIESLTGPLETPTGDPA